jgi:hypothetical protein
MLSQQMEAVARQAAKLEMIKGLLWFVGGAAVSGITYLAADPGGSYYVFWGAIAYGGYRLLRAIYYWLNPESLIRKS